jgi:branched-chain amino acid transport system permease protein
MARHIHLMGRAALAAIIAIIAIGFGTPVVVSLAAQAAIIAVLALGVGFLNRTLGLVSFGHAAPFGFGAYGAAIALGGNSLSPEMGVALVLVLAALVFFAIGLVVSRVEGIAFGMLTLAIGQGVWVAATRLRGVTGGADGLILSLPRRLFGLDSALFQRAGGMVVVAIIVLALVYVALGLFELSHTGRLAIAIRENEERAQFLGFRTRALRALVYAVSCVVAALGGVLFVLYQGFVSPEILHWSFSGSVLIMSILGGTVTLWGAIGGALVFFFVRDALSDFTSHWLSILGLSLIAVTVLWPSGLSGGALVLARRLGGRVRS